MGDQKPLPLIGRIALQLRMVTAEQLSELTQAQVNQGDTGGLGELMVSRGLIDRDQLKRLLDTQKQVVAKARARQAIDQAGRRAHERDVGEDLLDPRVQRDQRARDAERRVDQEVRVHERGLLARVREALHVVDDLPDAGDAFETLLDQLLAVASLIGERGLAARVPSRGRSSTRAASGGSIR